MSFNRRGYIRPVSNDDISQNFVRQARNFMNNWEVSGGSFSFDGYKASLRVNQASATLWRISTSGLEATIGSGRVTKWEPVNSRKEQEEVTTDNVATSNVLTLTASSTNYVYLKATMTPNATATNYIAWVASAYDFYTATSGPGNTVDFSDAVSGAGILYTKIATLVTNTSLVTSTTRHHWDAIDLAYPWTLNLDTFACPA
jgi:hypothetical protein